MREGTTILTLDNGYHLWTHTDNVGGKIRLLCLHGGPGGNHEYYENFAEKLKRAMGEKVEIFESQINTNPFTCIM